MHGAVERRNEPANRSADAGFQNLAAGKDVFEELAAAERRQVFVQHGVRRDFVAGRVDFAHLLRAMLGRLAIERHAPHDPESGARVVIAEYAQQHARAILIGRRTAAAHAEGAAVALWRIVVERDC